MLSVGLVQAAACSASTIAVFVYLITRIVEARLLTRRVPESETEGDADRAPGPTPERGPAREVASRPRFARQRPSPPPLSADGRRWMHASPAASIPYARPLVLVRSNNAVPAGPSARARPNTPSREVWDPIMGVQWRVTEHDPPPHLAHRCTHCLVYDSGGMVRRVCGQGADWHQRSDVELLALCHAPR